MKLTLFHCFLKKMSGIQHVSIFQETSSFFLLQALLAWSIPYHLPQMFDQEKYYFQFFSLRQIPSINQDSHTLWGFVKFFEAQCHFVTKQHQGNENQCCWYGAFDVKILSVFGYFWFFSIELAWFFLFWGIRRCFEWFRVFLGRFRFRSTYWGFWDFHWWFHQGSVLYLLGR